MDNWSLYFMNNVGWQLHPRNKQPVDIEKASKLATEMLKEQIKCRGSQQPPQ